MSYGSRRQSKVVVGMMIGLVLVFAGLAGCRSSTPVGESTPTLALTSSSFHEGEIPKQFTCDSTETSPSLAWPEPPAATKSFALIVLDKDSLFGSFVHWVLYDLPAEKRELPEGLPNQAQLLDGSRQGQNDFDKTVMEAHVLPVNQPIAMCLLCTRWIHG
jgi:phosphatidylethanolamine-binding protein (PEBP) family uncharacterized protein